MADINLIIDEIKKAEKEISNIKIDLSLKKKLFSYTKELYNIGKKYEMIYYYFEPSNRNDRSFQNELEKYLQNKEKGLEYQIKIELPKLKGINVENLEKKLII